MKRVIRIEEIVGYDDDGAEIVEVVERKLNASALLPRMYRFRFGHDLVKDMNDLAKAQAKALKGLSNKATDEEKKEAQFTATDLTVFENVAWCMMKCAGEEVGDSPDEWLERVPRMFSIYEILPVIFEAWAESQRTTSTP